MIGHKKIDIEKVKHLIQAVSRTNNDIYDMIRIVKLADADNPCLPGSIRERLPEASPRKGSQVGTQQ